MANDLRRVSVLALLLTFFWICVLPNPVFSQPYCVPPIAETNGTGNLCVCGFEERSELTPSFLDETSSSSFLRFFREAEWYFSWGISRESWRPTNIHISQPSQGNHFTVYDVRGVDDPSWHSLFGAQYNIRFGRFIDESHTLAVEFNMDHTKYTSILGQTAHVSGTIAGKPTDANVRLDDAFFSYKLHNGANHVMINLFKRIPLTGETNENFSVAAIAKVGAGLLVPHAENTIMGHDNFVGSKTFGNLIGTHSGWWRLDGWTTGIEVGFRVVLANPLYLEITDKVAFAQLGDVPVYQGTARHNLWMNEIILSVGVTFGGR